MTATMYYPGYSQYNVEQNLLVQPIASISNSYPMIVTTTNDHGYVAGMMVSFLIPVQYGLGQLTGINVQVLATPTPTTLSIDFDSSQLNFFSYPSPLPNAYTPASVIPNASGPYLPPLPLPFGNQDAFEGCVYNNGLINDPINGL